MPKFNRGNIYDPYPTSVEVDGTKYAVNMEYDRVLRAVDCCKDENLSDAEKLYLQARLIIVKPPKDPFLCIKIISAAFDLIPKGKGGRRYMDLHQDAKMIRSAFMRAYKMDLTREHPNIVQFMELLNDLPSDTAFMKTVELRQRPIPEPAPDGKNAKYIAALQKAKAAVAIEFSQEEREKMFADSLKNAFSSMAGR